MEKLSKLEEMILEMALSYTKDYCEEQLKKEDSPKGYYKDVIATLEDIARKVLGK